MGILLQVAINLVSALIGLLVGMSWHWTRKYAQLRGSRKFWAPFLNECPLFVLGRFREFSRFEQSGLVGAGDTMALSEIRTHLAKLGTREFSVVYSDRIVDGDAVKENLVLVGGPDVNLITERTLEQLNLTLKVKGPSGVYDSITGKLTTSEIDPITGNLQRDFGVIIRASNPFLASKHVVVIFGGYGYGTWAAARYVVSREFLDKLRVLRTDYVECVIQADVLLGSPGAIHQVVIRKLALSNN